MTLSRSRKDKERLVAAFFADVKLILHGDVSKSSLSMHSRFTCDLLLLQGSMQTICIRNHKKEP